MFLEKRVVAGGKAGGSLHYRPETEEGGPDHLKSAAQEPETSFSSYTPLATPLPHLEAGGFASRRHRRFAIFQRLGSPARAHQYMQSTQS